MLKIVCNTNKIKQTDMIYKSERLDIGARVTWDKNKEKGQGLLSTIKDNSEYPERYKIKGDGCGHYYAKPNEINEFKG